MTAPPLSSSWALNVGVSVCGRLLFIDGWQCSAHSSWVAQLVKRFHIPMDGGGGGRGSLIGFVWREGGWHSTSLCILHVLDTGQLPMLCTSLLESWGCWAHIFVFVFCFHFAGKRSQFLTEWKLFLFWDTWINGLCDQFCFGCNVVCYNSEFYFCINCLGLGLEWKLLLMHRALSCYKDHLGLHCSHIEQPFLWSVLIQDRMTLLCWTLLCWKEDAE